MDGHGTLPLLTPASAPGPLDPIFSGRERRLHARAFRRWASACNGQGMPLIDDLDRVASPDIASHGLLIDIPSGPPGPSIAAVGEALREEARLDTATPCLGDIPDGTLLAELLRHYPRIVAHRAPVEFEAEFVGRAGTATHYRGILLPFSRDGRRTAAVYGVISWAAIADARTAPDIVAAADSAQVDPGAPVSPWGKVADPATLPPQSFDQRVAQARTWAALAAADRSRRPASIHAALGGAHDLRQSEPGCDTETIVSLVFGGTAGRRQSARYALILDHAARLGIGMGQLTALLDRHPRGARGLFAAERRARRAEARGARGVTLPPIASGNLALAPINADFLLMLGRCGADVTAEPAAPRRAAG